MTLLSEDPRVRAGMPNHLLDRDAIVATGGRQIGWKLGLGTPAAREALGTPGALIAAITDRGLVGSGDLLDLSGYSRPVVEPEIAVHLRADLSGEVSVEEALAAIEGFGPAIEVADVPEDRGGVQAIVEGGIFHRAVVVGPPDTDTGAAELRTLSTWIERNGDVVARTEDPTAMTGDAVELIREVARYVGAFGETLRAGEIVITGSVVPPIAVAAGDTISVQFDRLGEVSIRF